MPDDMALVDIVIGSLSIDNTSCSIHKFMLTSLYIATTEDKWSYDICLECELSLPSEIGIFVYAHVLIDHRKFIMLWVPLYDLKGINKIQCSCVNAKKVYV